MTTKNKTVEPEDKKNNPTSTSTGETKEDMPLLGDASVGGEQVDAAEEDAPMSDT